MLTKRIIPCLDIKDGRTVKGVNFEQIRDAGDPIELGAFYASQGADELVFLDITATIEGRKTLSALVNKIAHCINIPFTVGGGIKTEEDVRVLLQNGADKISINTPALENPKIIDEFVKKFGSQAVVVGIDTKKINGINTIYKNTGKPEQMSAVKKTLEEWVMEVQERGAGEIVMNSINSDGTRNGYDISLLKGLRKIVKVPLIASGGAGEMQHFLDVFNLAHVDGARAASVFHKEIISIDNLKQFLASKNIPMRI